MKRQKTIVIIIVAILLLSLNLLGAEVFQKTANSSTPHVASQVSHSTHNNNSHIVPHTAPNVSVSIGNMVYTPSTITVVLGTTVTWTNNDTITHTVTSNTAPFDSGLVGPTGTFQFTFTTLGSFDYYCSLHNVMTGTVVVVDATSVTMPSDTFSSSTITITTGAKVLWTNTDTDAHTVTSDSPLFDSGNLASGDTFLYTFNQAGTFTYHCQYHNAMTGTVVVVDATPVIIPNDNFTPATITITVGSKVLWTNRDADAHTVTSDSPLFDSGNLASGDTFLYTFNQTGTFTYHCQYHNAMTGTVNVVPLATTTAIYPNTALAGSGSFTLTVDGTNFYPGAVINWAGTPISPTIFVSSTRLQTTVPAGNIAANGTFSITVTSTGATTNSQTFTVTLTCNNLLVTNNLDNGSCGSLRNAVNSAAAGNNKTIYTNLAPPAVITMTGVLTVANGISIYGQCSGGTPSIILNGSGTPPNTDGMVLTGNDLVYGLEIKGFTRKDMVVKGTGNKISCANLSR